MGADYVQSNLTGGEISPQLHSRIDIEKYSTSLAEAENVVILPQGGLKRRPGLSKIDTGKIGEDARLFPFIFNASQQYLLVFRPSNIDIFKDGVKVHTVTGTPFTTMTVIDGLDMIQSADTVIITEGSVQPYQLQRQGSDTSWALSAISLTIPTYDFGAGNEPVWSATKGWPNSCTFHQGRLWFGGSPELPTSVWGSKINGFYDFTATPDVDGNIPDDHAIFDTINSNQYNIITSIFSGRSLQVFTTGAEYYNTVDVITPNNSSWISQTGYGSKGIKPVFIDGATLFVDSSGRTIREFIYSFDEDGYVSNNITLLASHLLTDIKSISAIKGSTTDIADFVYVVNNDGTLAVMNTLRNEGVLGWTRWTTSGDFVDVCVVDKEVYFLVKRQGEYFLERINDDTYTDHNKVVSGTAPTTYNVTLTGYNVVHNLVNVNYTDTSTGSVVTSITTNYDQVFDNIYFKVSADFSIQPDAKPTVTAPGANTFSITRGAYNLEVGLGYNTKVTTLPMNSTIKGAGSTLHRRKRIVKADINIYNSLGVYVEDILSPDRKFAVALDEAPKPITGFKEVYLLGYGRIVQLRITQKNPLPLLIRSIGYEIEY